MASTYKDSIVLYFRGESRFSWELRPSLMRVCPAGHTPFRSVEAEMLNDLMTRQPESFGGLTSAIMEWVFAQHHGLRTRLLDITRNPLVALFFACVDDDDSDGRIHVFAVPSSLVKRFNSDTVKCVANFAKLSRGHQNMLLGKTEDDAPGDVFPAGVDGIARGLDSFAQAKSEFHSIIQSESPYLKERLDIRDLFRVFVLEPQQMFPRIRAQSGAFLMSAFHDRFERVGASQVES